MRPPAAAHELAVGDPVRTVIGRAVLGVPFAGVVFFAFTWVAKGVPVLYASEPWRDDPYDAIVSFAMWCVPLLVGLCGLRVPLCRRYRPLPVRRVLDLLRVSRVLVGVVLLTLAGEWVSVALRLHAEAWTATTGVLIAVLAVVTVLGAAAALALRRVGREPVWQAARAQPDWLADAIALGEREAARLGPWRDLALAVLRWLDDEVVARVRSHPLLAAAVFSLLFAMAIEAAQIIVEGYTPALALLFISVSACSVFAFVVIAGAYLRVVGREAGPPSRAVLAAIVASAAVPLAAAFRGSLWWLLGTNDRDAGLTQLAQLVFLAALVTGVGTLAATTLVRSLRQRQR